MFYSFLHEMNVIMEYIGWGGLVSTLKIYLYP